jgi:hypothetical protein
MNGYFLEGINGEHLLVFRSHDEESVLRIIKKLRTSRDKEIKALADRLELEWFDRHK